MDISERLRAAWIALVGRKKKNELSRNENFRVFTDRSRSWLDINLAPRGVKLHLLTTGGIATHGEVNEKTIFQFVGWEPLPSTPTWMKELMCPKNK